MQIGYVQTVFGVHSVCEGAAEDKYFTLHEIFTMNQCYYKNLKKIEYVILLLAQIKGIIEWKDVLLLNFTPQQENSVFLYKYFLLLAKDKHPFQLISFPIRS